MSSQLFINPFPCGSDILQHSEEIYGSLLLAGSATVAGEPINFNNIVSGIQYNESNYRGQGPTVATGSAYTTGFAVSAGIATVTANNNFIPGQTVTFAGNTGVLSALFNGQSATVVSATSSSFTVATSNTGTTTTGDVGFCYSGRNRVGYSASGPTLQATVTNLAATAASGGVPAFITVTATNYFLPGASVTFANLTTTLGLLMNGVQFTVVSSTGAAFVVYSTLTGSAGADTGTATGNNCPQPAQVDFWSANNSGYIYQYKASTGNLFVLQSASLTPAGTISAPTITTLTNAGITAPVYVNGGALTETTGATGITGVQAPTFTGTATTAAALAKLAAAAYPAGVLGDLIKYRATFAKGQ